MADYLVQDTELTGVANHIRAKGGTSELLVWPDGYEDAIDAIQTGGILQSKSVTPTESAQTVTPDTGYDGLSQVSVGAISKTYVGSNIPRKSSSDLTASGATVTVPSGYYASQASKSVASGSVTVNTPSVNSSGLVTATATVGAGYVAAATPSKTLQLTTQAAQTITPGTTNQTIASGRYLTGTQTIKGDANLVAANIAQGVSIFGVTGTHSGGGTDVEDSIITETISGTYENSRVTYIGGYRFYWCAKLTTVNFPACMNIGENAFYSCTSLTTVSFSACISIYDNAFYNCSRLTTVNFPACRNIFSRAFYSCRDLSTVNFPACTSISSYAFCRCFKLISLYLTGSSYVSLSHSNAFSSTPIGGYSASAGRYGSIYVPASMLASYKTRTNWTYFSSRFVGV